LAILVFAFIFSCKTTKSRTEELTGIKKLYHNTTARYNGYFNADVLLNNSILALEETHQDNYNKILPVYEYIEIDPVQNVNKDLDIAIEKVSIVATLHRQSDWTDDCYLLLGKAQYLKQDFESAEETFEYSAKEFSPSALAQRAREAARRGGKKRKVQAKKSPAQKAADQESQEEEDEIKLSKKEQAKQREKTNKAIKKKKIKDRKAREKARKRRKKGKKSKKTKTTTDKKNEEKKVIEDPVKKIVDEPKKKKVKKEKEKPENQPENLFKSEKLAIGEIQLWLARTYIEREDYNLAERYIQYVEGDGVSKEVSEQVDAVKAHLYLKQKRYDSAIPHLDNAIDNVPNREYKARYAYIRAQLAERNNNNAVAAEYFSKAIKYSNRYELEFNARLAMLKSSYSSGSKTMAATTRELERMLKDDKNTEYHDQVYFTLAELNLESGDKLAAIENFRNSLNSSSRNNTQRTETYLKLAELYYEEETYVDAKLYYDSTLQVIEKSDERYDYVKNLSENLIGIAENLQIIALQDSLLNIIDLSDKEREALAIKLKEEADDRKAKGLASNKPTSSKLSNGRDLRVGSNIAGPSRGRQNAAKAQPVTQFPLYNKKTQLKGAKDFVKNWGDRVLEDNWRRSNRQQFDNIAAEPIAVEAVQERLTKEDIDKILKDVPSGEAEISAANKKIENAYFELGRLYRDRLQRDDKTIDAHESELLRRYPDTEHQLDAWYYLYLAHGKQGNKAQEKKYFDLIVKNFPNTTYARVLTDPNYLEAAKQEGNKLGNYYQNTYTQFQNKQYEKVIQEVDQASEQFGPSNIMMAKFALLKAMSVGNVKGKNDYVTQLKEVIAKYPNSPEETRAREILRLLGDKSVTVQPKTDMANSAAKSGDFKVEPEGLHYVAVVITNKNDEKITAAKSALADFNKEFFKNDNLRLSNIFLNNDTEKPIIVIRKFSSQKKAMVYVKAANNSGDDFLTTKMDYVVYPLTQSNYRSVLRNRSFDGYDEFFKENY